MIKKAISRLTLLPSRSRNLCDYPAISNGTLRGFFACLDLVAAGSKYRCSVRVGNRGKRLQNGCIATHICLALTYKNYLPLPNGVCMKQNIYTFFGSFADRYSFQQGAVSTCRPQFHILRTAQSLLIPRYQIFFSQ